VAAFEIMMPVRWGGAIVLAAMAGTSCSDGGDARQAGPPSPSAPQISAIDVRVSAAVVLVGHPEPLALTVTYQDGSTVAPNKASWTTDNPAVAVVDHRGTLQPRANGVVTITAAVGDATGRRQVRVAPDYGGSWQGISHIADCEGAWCGRNARFQPSDQPFRMTLTQDGTRVSGQLVLGRTEGFVFCDLAESGSLQFDGMYDPPDLSWKEVKMREWDSRVENNRLLGTFWYGEPDSFELRVELTSIVRQAP